MKKISILGSTGSIGTQALDVVRKRPSDYKVCAISAYSNAKLLYEQALEFKPSYVVIVDKEGYSFLKEKLHPLGIKVINGFDGLEYISTIEDVDTVLTSVVGMIGLKPTIAAIRAGKRIALANKETLVVGGEIIKRELEKSKAEIIPVDSEHSAIYQSLKSGDKKEVNRLIVTASGGPFRGRKKEDLSTVTVDEALNHPRWKMGKKISIDSATLMNKGLEVIEAHWLFDIAYNNIDVVVHPQSTIHSMVEFIDGSIIAQMGNTDMRHPIQYALDYPERKISTSGYLDLIACGDLTFEKPDIETFKCLKLGIEAGKIGGSMPAVLNAANEEAVGLFLDRKIKFLDIAEIIEKAMNNHKVEKNIDIDSVIDIDNDTRKYVYSLIK